MQVTVHLCLLDYVFGVRYRKGVPVLRSVGTRELKQHTGEIVERVRNGERVVLTLRGEPVAVISPLDGDAIREAVESEARKAERESLGWLAASESSFSFWENEDDVVWDEGTEEHVDRAGG
jgi:prevent-host-death family protein